MTSGSEAAIGSELAGYRIEALIGRGGMGAVYRAEELTLGRKVALKVIAPELAQDSRFRERFLRESRIAASLDHPHIVPIFKAGEEDGALFLAMRYVEGTDLGKLLREGGALDPRRAIALLEQVADGLDAAHEKGLVHRDIKPSNVLVSRAAGKEHAYLADFGLTKRTGSLSGVSAAGDVVGTLEYVAPEQITGEEVGPAADLYSLGCVLYECLTGQSPFPARPTSPSSGRTSTSRRRRRAASGRSSRRRSTASSPAPSPRTPRAATQVRTSSSPPPAPRSAWSRPRLRSPPGADSYRLLPCSSSPRSRLPSSYSGTRAAASLGSPRTRSGSSTRRRTSSSRTCRSDSSRRRSPPPKAASGSRTRETRRSPASIRPHARIATSPPIARVPGATRATSLPGTGRSGWRCQGRPNWRRIDPESGDKAERPITVGRRAPSRRTSRIDLGAGSVWHLSGNAQIARFDPRTGEARQIGAEEFLLVFQDGLQTQLSDVAFGFGSLWLTNQAGNSVTEFDPGTDRVVSQVAVGGAPIAIAVRARTLWVANFGDDTVSRIEVPEPGVVQQPRTVETFPVGDGPVDLAVDETGVWVANSLDRTVSRIDPESGDVVATIDIGNEPRRIAAGEGAVWVTVQTPAPVESSTGRR